MDEYRAMKRILLDTNIYEHLLIEVGKPMLETVVKEKKLIFYGTETVRKELRDIPVSKKYATGSDLRNLRISLLQLYDLTVGKHHYQSTHQMEDVAEKYFALYRSYGGKEQKEGIISDFLIVACACLHHLDIVVSEDSKTMVSEPAKKAYDAVNHILEFKTPKFYRFLELKKMLRGGRLD
jgi:predicted nucleic acid-binding protein